MKLKYTLTLACLSIYSFAQATDLDDLHYTNEEQVVAMTILGEARGEGKIGMMMVADVIYTRAHEGQKPADVICLQYKQFDCWNHIPKDKEKWNKFLDSKEGKIALTYATMIMKSQDPCKGIANTHFYSHKPPYWAKGQIGTRVGNHVFIRLK